LRVIVEVKFFSFMSKVTHVTFNLVHTFLYHLNAYA
jgi:hypothetical protein